MNTFQQGLNTLADRIRGGEPSAAREFRREIEPHLARIVGHVLRGGIGPAPLTRQIFATAADVEECADPRAQRDIDALARQVAWRLCDAAVNRLRPDRGPSCAAAETVRF